jgi:hypothetical protein
MQGTRNIDKQYLKPMVGLGLEPIYEGSNEGLYRLKLEGEVKPLIGDAVLPRGSVSLEAEAFTSGTVERDSRNFGRDIGVITSPRYPAYAEYSVNVTPGKYELRLRFASGESRPLTVRLNGEVVSTTGATDSTGGWGPQNQMWQPVALVEMRGSNVIRLESASPFPHVDKLGLVPAGALPKVH